MKRRSFLKLFSLIPLAGVAAALPIQPSTPNKSHASLPDCPFELYIHQSPCSPPPFYDKDGTLFIGGEFCSAGGRSNPDLLTQFNQMKTLAG